MFNVNEVEQRFFLPTLRPAVFFGMNAMEMNDLRQWLEDQPGSHEMQADLYAGGVRFGLAQIGQEFSALPGASPLTHPWADALGTVWRWDDESIQPVADKTMDHPGSDDFADLSDSDFVCFVRGLLDGTAACGWTAGAQATVKQSV